MDTDTLRNTLTSWPISMKFHLDSHSCMHPVSLPVYATGITNPQNYHVAVYMEWQAKYNYSYSFYTKEIKQKKKKGRKYTRGG
jgi:hypothetical protein